MARLLFKGEYVEVKVTHNVLSEMVRLTGIGFVELVSLNQKDPMGWMRDVLYCSLKVYNPDNLGTMTHYEVGDILFNVTHEERLNFMKELSEDLVVMSGGKKPQEVDSAESAK
jgi:hypothetical protein